MAISAESLEYICDPVANDKEAIMPEGTKNNRKSVVRWFLGFTSIGGLAQVNNTDQRLSKSIWSLVFVIGAIATLWNFIGVWEDYYSNQVSKFLNMISYRS